MLLPPSVSAVRPETLRIIRPITRAGPLRIESALAHLASECLRWLGEAIVAVAQRPWSGNGRGPSPPLPPPVHRPFQCGEDRRSQDRTGGDVHPHGPRGPPSLYPPETGHRDRDGMGRNRLYRSLLVQPGMAGHAIPGGTGGGRLWEDR